jgi:hypothetical protein
MDWEFPAVSQSTIDVWKTAQYTRKGMWWFTLFFGFFGLHHLLLRSPQTTILFIIANVLSLGYCYFFDLIQLSAPEYGGVGTKGLNKFGLSHPWGPLGVAKGMWIDDPEEVKIVPRPPPLPSAPPAAAGQQEEAAGKQQQEQKQQEVAGQQQEVAGQQQAAAGPMVGGAEPKAKAKDEPPSPWFFFIYSLLLPIAPLALTIAGDGKNALTRLLFLTIIPFGFILYGFSIVYDYFILLAKPTDVLLFGSKRPFPFNMLGMDKDGHSSNITGKEDLIGCPPANNLQMLLGMALPLLRIAFPEAADGIEQALQTAQTVKQTGMEVANKTVAAGKQAAETAQQFKGAADTLVTKVPQAIGQAEQLASNPESLIPKAKMVGGGAKDQESPILQGLTLGTMAALIGGGLLLQISRSFTLPHDRTDSPPNPGRI